jgi:transcriptional regulator with XRE-family HTH domain
MDKSSYREVMGQKLQEFRESRNLSRYAVAQKGKIRVEQVKAVEEGLTNYTIDVFLGYIAGSDLYMYFAEKYNENNFKDLIDM